MAFTLQTWARSSAGANEGATGSIREHVYISSDAQATMAGSAYFGDVADKTRVSLGTEVRTGDQVWATSTSEVTTVHYSLVVTAGVVTTLVIVAV